MDEATLTEQQRKWFASVRRSLETSTGRSVEQWVEIARACPETRPRARLRWFKETHGLGQNYASAVLFALGAADGARAEAAEARGAPAAPLWAAPGDAAILAALRDAVAPLAGIVSGERKTFTSWSRRYAFAAARPVKGGVRLGLALAPDAEPGLEPARANEGWSERLTAACLLASAHTVDARVAALLREAWKRS